MTRVKSLIVFVGLASCWDTGGLGPGPYVRAVSVDDCAGRGLEGAVGYGDEDGGRRPLFCTDSCAAGPGECPLSEYIAGLDADLSVECRSIKDVSLCVIVTASECPPSMVGVVYDGVSLCYFDSDEGET
jgi:hypothetical protein